MAADASAITIGRVVRLLDGALAPLPCVSLRYYGRCSCPDEATCPLRDVMIDVRDVMLQILDKETLAELAAREGRAAIDPRGLHEDALAGRRP
jgi:DNA-binding IscR family transcriptional regulator